MRSLFDLAADQHGVFSVRQAGGHGLGRQELRTLVTKGLVTPTLPGVYRVVGSPETWWQRVHAATLWLPGSLASHRTAAALHQFRGCDQAPVEVLVERWTRRHRPPHLLVHETKDLVAGDITDVRRIPCTTIVRTLVDLPAVVRDRKAGEAIDGASKDDPTVLARVRRRHLEVARRGRNGTVRLRRLLEQRVEGEVLDSPFERMALDLIAGSPLPRPVTQHKVVDGEFTAYLDLAWPDHLVAMECDSYEHHRTFAAFQWGRARRRRLTALGWRILEFTHGEVDQKPAMVLAELDANLADRSASGRRRASDPESA